MFSLYWLINIGLTSDEQSDSLTDAGVPERHFYPIGDRVKDIHYNIRIFCGFETKPTSVNIGACESSLTRRNKNNPPCGIDIETGRGTIHRPQLLCCIVGYLQHRHRTVSGGKVTELEGIRKEAVVA
jgi:hypothetical protein